MNNWISRKQALKEAQVNVFDAKRYLAVYLRFVPLATVLQGNKVAPVVSKVLTHFKTLEAAGLTMEQIEYSIAKNINNVPEKN